MLASAPIPPKLFAVIPFLFVGIWLSVSFIISLSGWQSFARLHPAPKTPSGRSYGSPVCWFGSWGRYRNAVRVVLSAEGVYFAMPFFFRIFHAPFLVPWASVTSVAKKPGIFGDRYWLEIQDSAGKIRLCLPATAEAELSQYRKTA